MKTFLTSILVLFYFYYSSFSTSAALDTNEDKNLKISIPTADEINKTIEGLRPLIPKLIQVAEFVHVNLTELFDGNLITGDLNLSNLTISKLDGFLVPYLDLIARVSAYFRVILDVPEIDINSEFEIDANIVDLLAINGSGSASIQLQDLQIDVSGYANVQVADPIKILNVTGFKIDILLGKVKIDVEGLLDNNDFSETVSSLLTGLANSLIVSNINQNHEQISADLSPKIEEIINDLLNGDTSSIVLDNFIEQFISVFQKKMIQKIM